ncbi:MAG: molybdopterin molybdotransferase MoeA, partial [Candidatus Korarchaeota archaeon]|nr:molybdopterin molybdotransferase MoeA [Candidatus Korarchaeota archaeon]
MTRIFKRLTPVGQALATYLNYLHPTSPEEVALNEAGNRVLAEDVISPIDIPPFHRAAFDGYAVRSSDTFGATASNPVVLKVVGRLGPGDESEVSIREGEAVEIATGSYLPNGADAVVPLEFSKGSGDHVEIIRQVPPGANVDRKGSDVSRGDTVLRRGTVIGPFEMLLLASLNITEVRVFKKPTVSIISTGSELVELGSPLGKGRIVNSNRYALESMISDLAVPRYLGIAKDDEGELREMVERGMDGDLIVTIAGTSVGERDLVPKIVGSLGGEIVFHGLSIMPGKPTLLAMIDGTPLVGLPGSPVAAMVAAMEVLLPVLARLSGVEGVLQWPRVRARLDRRIASRPGVRHYVRVKLRRESDALLATPVRVGGSGIISSLTQADGFVVVPEDVEGYEAGSEVDVLVYRRWLKL